MSDQAGTSTRDKDRAEMIARREMQQMLVDTCVGRLDELIQLMREFDRDGEAAWIEFNQLSAEYKDPNFAEITQHASSRPKRELQKTLQDHHVFVSETRTKSKTQCILECLNADEAPVMTPEQTNNLGLDKSDFQIERGNRKNNAEKEGQGQDGREHDAAENKKPCGQHGQQGAENKRS
jgi:hypothetical protein